jgi:glucose/arabinose dehydrogenase
VPDTRGHDDLLDLPYVNDPTHNPDGDQLDCAAIRTTMLGLPAHSAPLGLTFTTGSALEATLGLGALITSHGSWNREPPRAPGVAFSPWDADTATLGTPVDLVSGFQGPDGSRWGRTVDAVPGPDGSLYITDDEAGRVYRVSPGP